MFEEFCFKKYKFEFESGVLELEYAVDGQYDFKEQIVFPSAPFILIDEQKQALDQVFKYLHIAAGISYYKAFLPCKLVFDGYTITKPEAEFFRRFYVNGLGEFAVRNNLHPFANINFPYDENATAKSFTVNFNDEVLVPIGGGKDSCLTIELLRDMGINATAIACGEPKPIAEVIKISGLPKIIITRKIAPELIELNQKGIVYNGHVPITGILAFVLWVSAILYKKKYVVMSCERSATSGNMEFDGVKINHQYSKSYDFEQDFYRLTQAITPDFRYFSLLRPISEIHIAKLFTQYCEKYFDVFTSCNKAFKLDERQRLNHWCGNCDKCRFVFLILAPFMDKQKLLKIVGNNPLDDKNQLVGYEELLGKKGHKPFECVGEFEESEWALAQLQKRAEWQNDYVVKNLKTDPQYDEKELFSATEEYLIPKRFQDVMARFRE